MSEGHDTEGHERLKPGESGDENASNTIREAVTGAKDADPAAGTQPIGDGGQHAGQTQTPAPDDEVGVPDDVGDDTQ